MRKPMSPLWISIAAFAVFIYLIIVNAFVFPIIFADGLAEKFTNARYENLPLFHLLAFAVTSLLLTILVDKLAPRQQPGIDGLFAGGLLGLLVALPEHLHLYAMTDATAVAQLIPVVWTLVTWSVAGMIVSIVRVRDRRGL